MRRRTAALVAALAVLTGCSMQQEASSNKSPMTCAQLAGKAVTVSHEQHGTQPELLDVKKLRVVSDQQQAPPTSSDQEDVVLLECKGVGVFSDALDRPVDLTLTTNSTGERFVYYKSTFS